MRNYKNIDYHEHKEVLYPALKMHRHLAVFVLELEVMVGVNAQAPFQGGCKAELDFLEFSQMVL